ncbi:MAG TPA: DUF721 domain-containing protein [Paracoccaceae bacterium]|nr:DUF721 domain-containing protein [Paracoccaceae bacterium]
MAGQDAPKRQLGKGQPSPRRHGRGFAPAGGFLAPQLGSALARRGIAETRILTHWAEVVGPDLAAHCRPLRISHGTGGVGGTLVIAAAPGRGPELSMLAPLILERVNAACGHRAVSRVRLMQGEAEGFGAGGFAEAPAGFDRSGAPEAPALPAAARAHVGATVSGVADPGLRAALERLGLGVAQRRRQREEKGQA